MSMENLGPYSNFHELNQDWLLNEFNKVLEQWKAMQKNFDSLQDAFNDLKSYVQDYFKNLDVQDEINNKLDSLIKSGVFDTILDNYFLKKCNTYNTAIDMINDMSLKDGNLCITQGYYKIGDSGKGTYFITSSPDSEALCLKLKNNLYARLWYSNFNINIKSLGVTETTDIGNFINNLLKIKSNKWYSLYIPYGSYTLKTTIIIDNITNFKIYGDVGSTIINCTSDAIRIYGGSYSIIENIIFNGSGYEVGYSLSDKHFNDQTDRSGNTELNNTNFKNFLIGIRIDAPSGYNLFNRVQISSLPENGIGIQIGKNYSNKSGILPNYIYFTNCNIDAKDIPNATCKGIDIHCGQYINFNKCDIANFKQSTAIIVDCDIDSISDIAFIDCQLFNNKINANIDRTVTNTFLNIRFYMCVLSSYITNSIGIKCKPKYLINCFDINNCVFLGTEDKWDMLLDFNDNVFLNVNTSTNMYNPFKHTNLPSIDKICASPKWLYGKVTTSLTANIDSEISLTVGSNNGWKKITDATPITTIHNFNADDKALFGEIKEDVDNNTKTCKCYTPSTNKNPIIASLSIL